MRFPGRKRLNMKRQYLKQALGYIVLISLVLQIVTRVTSTHIHILADGNLIAHTHPYHHHEDSKDSPQHRHESKELFFFEHFEVLFPVIFIALLIIALFNLLDIFKISGNKYPEFYVFLLQGRSPPSMPVSL